MTRTVVPLRTMPDEAPSVPDSFKIREGRVLIFHRADSPNWFALWRSDDGTPTQVSLRTADKALATQRATELHMEHEIKVKHGISVKTATFEHVCDVLLVEVAEELRERGKQHTTKLKDYKTRIERYFKPYFGDKPIDAIKASDIARYRDWRRAYWLTGPGSQQTELTYVRNGKTIKVQGGPSRKGNAENTLPEDVTLRAIFDCAAKYGWINQERIPKIETKKGRDNPRGHFTPEEIDILLASEAGWIEAGRNEKIRDIRRLAADYVSVLLTTGVRPGEALGLKWGDVEFFRDKDDIRNMRVWVADDSKTGRRDAVAFARGEVTVTAMALARDAERKRKDQPLFVTPDGRRINSFAGQFASWLRFAGLLKNARGETRTIYCCRHTFITEALAVGHSHHLIAQQCGTGTGMIDRFYSKVSASLNASQLSGRKPVR